MAGTYAPLIDITPTEQELAQRYYFYVRPAVEEEVPQEDDKWAGTISRITKHAEKISKRTKKALAKLSSTVLTETTEINETMGKVEDTQIVLKREFADALEKVESN